MRQVGTSMRLDHAGTPRGRRRGAGRVMASRSCSMRGSVCAVAIAIAMLRRVRMPLLMLLLLLLLLWVLLLLLLLLCGFWQQQRQQRQQQRQRQRAISPWPTAWTVEWDDAAAPSARATALRCSIRGWDGTEGNNGEVARQEMTPRTSHSFKRTQVTTTASVRYATLRYRHGSAYTAITAITAAHHAPVPACAPAPAASPSLRPRRALQTLAACSSQRRRTRPSRCHCHCHC